MSQSPKPKGQKAANWRPIKKAVTPLHPIWPTNDYKREMLSLSPKLKEFTNVLDVWCPESTEPRTRQDLRDSTAENVIGSNNTSSMQSLETSKVHQEGRLLFLYLDRLLAGYKTGYLQNYCKSHLVPGKPDTASSLVYNRSTCVTTQESNFSRLAATKTKQAAVSSDINKMRSFNANLVSLQSNQNYSDSSVLTSSNKIEDDLDIEEIIQEFLISCRFGSLQKQDMTQIYMEHLSSTILRYIYKIYPGIPREIMVKDSSKGLIHLFNKLEWVGYSSLFLPDFLHISNKTEKKLQLHLAVDFALNDNICKQIIHHCNKSMPKTGRERMPYTKQLRCPPGLCPIE